MGAERRRFSRIKVRFLVEYRGEKIWQNARADNLSKGGLFIITDKTEPKGTEIEVIFDFGKGDRRTFQARGEVAWSREEPKTLEDGSVLPAGMGIEFKKLFPQDAERYLDEIIKHWKE